MPSECRLWATGLVTNMWAITKTCLQSFSPELKLFLQWAGHWPRGWCAHSAIYLQWSSSSSKSKSFEDYKHIWVRRSLRRDFQRRKERSHWSFLHRVYCLVFLPGKKLPPWNLMFGPHFSVCTALSHLLAYLTLSTSLRNRWGRHPPHFPDNGVLSPFSRQQSWDSQRWRQLPVVPHRDCQVQRIFHPINRARKSRVKTSALLLHHSSCLFTSKQLSFLYSL